MAKTVKCKVCGATIAKNAKACPQCGAKRRGAAAKAAGVFLALLGVALIASALADSSSRPHKVSDAEQPPAATEQTVFFAGDKVALGDVAVTLVSVEESRGGNYLSPEPGQVFLICQFEIENNSNRDIAVSSLASFEAYVDDYAVNLDLSATVSSGLTQLDGAIAPGKKMNGAIGYAADQGWSNIELHFTPDFWSGRDIVFQYDKA